MQSFYVNKRGQDAAIADGAADAQPLKAKAVKGLKEFTLYTKPMKKKKLYSTITKEDGRKLYSPEQHWCHSFPQAYFILIRQCSGITPKPLSSEVKEGEYDHVLLIETLPNDQDGFTKWRVVIGEDTITLTAA